ncbi:MAG: hypothetical protein WED82_01890 [Balneolales bacterium]
MDEPTYTLFDQDDREFTPVVTSNANIKRVCGILTQCSFKSHQERVYYAQLGDIAPGTDEDGTLVYNFTEVFSTKAVASAAIAQSLFYDFPTLIKTTDKGHSVLDKELYAQLIRSEVWRAFEDWLGKFGENPFEVTSFLNTLASNPSLTTIIQTMSNLAAGSKNMNTTATGGSGSGDSSPETESGRK